MTLTGKGTPKVKSENFSDDDDILQKQIRAAVKHALQAGTGRQGRKGQRRQGKKKPGRDLHDADPARILYRARRFQTKQRESGWPVLFALIFFPVKQSSGIVQDEERNK